MTNRASLPVRALSQVRLMVNRAGYDVIREPFKHRFIHALGQHDIDTVLDIGANTGQFGQQLRRSGFGGRIHSVEPLAAAYAGLQASAAGDPGWTTQRAAVAAAPGTITMNVSENSVSSSVLPILDRSTDAAPQTAYVASEEVPATTVDEIVVARQLTPERALLKVDVQGYELPVLDGAAASLAGFAAVRAEMSLVALYDGQALLPDMIAYLAGHGFDLWYIEPGFVEPGTRRLLQLDGIFFRPTPDPSAPSTGGRQ